MNERVAAVCHVRGYVGGKPGLLVVWNRRYRGWTLPGGLVEEGESSAVAAARELRAETALQVLQMNLAYEAPVKPTDAEPWHRGRRVEVYDVTDYLGFPKPNEDGCPVAFFTRVDFLAACPFAEFYREMFDSRPAYWRDE